MHKRRDFLGAITIALGIYGCIGGKEAKLNHIENVYKNGGELVEMFENKSVLIRGNLIVLIVKTTGKDDKFFFERSYSNENTGISKFSLSHREINDSSAITILGDPFSKKFLHDTLFDRTIENLIKKYADKLAEYSVKEVTSEFSQQGINLKFYLEGNISMLYVKNTAELKSDWITYIKNASRLDDNWYYYFNENPLN